MFELWHLAELDLLDETTPYVLESTGQGLQRVQSPRREVEGQLQSLPEKESLCGHSMSTLHSPRRVCPLLTFLHGLGEGRCGCLCSCVPGRRKTARVKKRMQQIVAAVQAQEQGYAGPARGALFPGALRIPPPVYGVILSRTRARLLVRTVYKTPFNGARSI